MAEYTNEDGSTYEGEVNDLNLPHGQGTHIWPDGTKYVGEWKEGVVNGQGTYTRTDGKKYEGIWKDYTLDSMGTLTTSDGKIYSQSEMDAE